MDEVDKLFLAPFASDFFGLVRSWHNSRSTEPDGPWNKLTVVIAYATEPDLRAAAIQHYTHMIPREMPPEQPTTASSRQSQTIISLLAECSRTARSNNVRSSLIFPFSAKIFGICATRRGLFETIIRQARLDQASPSARGSACKTRRSLADGSFERISVRRGSSSEIKRSRVRSGRVIVNSGTRASKSSRARTSSKVSGECNF